MAQSLTVDCATTIAEAVHEVAVGKLQAIAGDALLACYTLAGVTSSGAVGHPPTGHILDVLADMERSKDSSSGKDGHHTHKTHRGGHKKGRRSSVDHAAVNSLYGGSGGNLLASGLTELAKFEFNRLVFFKADRAPSETGPLVSLQYHVVRRNFKLGRWLPPEAGGKPDLAVWGKVCALQHIASGIQLTTQGVIAQCNSYMPKSRPEWTVSAFEQSVEEACSMYIEFGEEEAKLELVRMACRWPHFGMAFYPVTQSSLHSLPSKVVFAVYHDGIKLLEPGSLQVLKEFVLGDVMNHCANDERFSLKIGNVVGGQTFMCKTKEGPEISWVLGAYIDAAKKRSQGGKGGERAPGLGALGRGNSNPDVLGSDGRKSNAVID